MKNLIFILGLLFSSSSFLAQNEIDALRYSYLTGGGTARYMGLAGAYGAVGADLSAVSTNPAGLGRYSKSEFIFTPGYQLGSSNSTYNGTKTFNGKNNLNLTNIGFVSTKVNEKPHLNTWKAVQFSITYNKLQNFHTQASIKGDSESSLTHAVANYANGYSYDDNINGDPFYSGLFLDGELIYEDTPNTYLSFVETKVTQNKEIIKSGQVGETALSLSGNYDDFIYIGGTIGIDKINYKERNIHIENILNQDESLIKDFTYREELDVLGRGFNLKLGTIFLPADWLRIGVAYHSPTFFSMSEEYKTSLNSNDTIYPETFKVSSPINNFSYKIKTPSKILLSSMVVIKKKGFVSIDYEMSKPQDALLKNSKNKTEDFKYENEAIKIIYRQVNVLRIGSEWKLSNNYVARIGYALQSSPLKKENVNYNNTRKTFSLGMGFRQKNFYLDVAFANTSWREDHYLYDPSLVDATKIEYYQNQLLTTFGFKF